MCKIKTLRKKLYVQKKWNKLTELTPSKNWNFQPSVTQVYRGESVRKSLKEAFPADIVNAVYRDKTAVADAVV
jgi:hypothetical protein